MSEERTIRGLGQHISPLGAWALSLGTSIGWGSLVVTSNTYLIQAGPAGSVAGLMIGAAMMLVVARNYHYLMNGFPDAGGAYSYAKEIFGYDYGFLVSWFLTLTYASILWANLTSLPLFAKFFLGNIFNFGRLYSLFGYDVYIGEILLTIAALLLFALLCSKRRRLTFIILTVTAVMLAACITLCFVLAMLNGGSSGVSAGPAFIPDSSELSQVIKIACISPWAFIGFENISHCSEEFTFPRRKVFRIFIASVLAATVLYCLVFLLSVSAYPPKYSSWFEYISDLDSLSGIEALPPFYAAYHYLGQSGVTLLIVALLGLIITSLIGNITALGRLFYSLAKDSVIPQRYASINESFLPGKAIMLIALISLPVPFLGRVAIGWIVDVTTICATLIYGLVSAASVKLARVRNDRVEITTGRIGIVLMVIIAAYLLLPNFFSIGSMEKESFFLFVVWGILGFIFFRNILRRDTSDRFGKSLIVWIALLSLVLMIALIWMSQSMMSSTNEAMNNIHEYYVTAEASADIEQTGEAFIDAQLSELRASNNRTILGATAMFVFALIILLTNYSYMNKKALESAEALGAERNRVNTDPLTGVKSKHAFTEFEKDIDSKINSGEAGEFSLVVCDVNGLKYVNDTYGHKAGDEYIKSASKLICGIFDHSPVFRIGGDEFFVFLSGSDHEHRTELLSQFNKQVESNIDTGDVVIAAGSSDYVPGQDRTMHSIFERADSLMYDRKEELRKKGAKTRS